MMQTKFPVTVMVFGVMSLDGDMMLLHIFPKGIRVNSDVYIELLKTKMLSWIKKVAKERPWVWQQDCTLPHIRKINPLDFIQFLCLCFSAVGSGTWTVNAEQEAKLERAEMRMVRWMCGMSLREKKTNAELRESMGIEKISDVMRCSRLRWMGHVLRKEGNDWVKKSMDMTRREQR